MREAVIDAGVDFDQRARGRCVEPSRGSEADAATVVEGARGTSGLGAVRRKWPAGAKTFVVVTTVVIVAVAGVVLYKARQVTRNNEERKRGGKPNTEMVQNRLPELKRASLPEQAVPVAGIRRVSASTSPPATDSSGGMEVSASETESAAEILSDEEIVKRRRMARGFGGGGELQGTPGLPLQAQGMAALAGLAGQGGATKGAASGGGLQEKLEPMQLKMAAADVLPNRDYLVTQGTMIDCVLETKIVSTVPGMTSCHLTRNVYSTNGRVVLLDRGAKVVGFYQGGVQQGQARIFVQWTRVETPNGVVVELNSPGTGSLGEAGVGGWIDTHFWERFGAAILLSIIDDAADTAVAHAGGGYGQNNNISFSNTTGTGKDMAAKALENSINIPPTLYKNQGERVGIFVARDLDFRGVYGLERAESPERD